MGHVLVGLLGVSTIFDVRYVGRNHSRFVAVRLDDSSCLTPQGLRIPKFHMDVSVYRKRAPLTKRQVFFPSVRNDACGVAGP
jgi:hypothetical protein